MRTIKNLLAVLFIAFTLQMADSTTTQAKPTSTFQRIVVRTSSAHRRVYVRRPYRRPMYHRPYRRPVQHRPYHRQYRRY